MNVMKSDEEAGLPDVMQVCRNGHVITDLLHTFPERGRGHCDRCGADTLERCPTCGRELPGAVYVPGLVPVGNRRPPQFCATCGAAFPWTERPPFSSPSGPLRQLETLLRRLPLVVRQLRARQGERPPFAVEDVGDLEDLVRALLPLYFDDICQEGRAPSYAAGNRTDFLLCGRTIAVTVKHVLPSVGESQLATQIHEDAAYYARQGPCRTLLVGVYDPELLLLEPRRLETAWSRPEDELKVRCVIAS
jgi:hypothetical protein